MNYSQLKKQSYIFITLFLFYNTSAIDHPSSYPFIAGNTFWNFCDFVIDENIEFDPLKVNTANTILLQAHLFEKFFTEYHPIITHPYILVTANCGINADDPVPGPFKLYLEDSKIIAWFSQNIDIKHPKLHPIPIGLANQEWDHGNVSIFKHYIETKIQYSHHKLLYLNFSTWTYPHERNLVYNFFSKKTFCTTSQKKNLDNYLVDLLDHKFTLSPRGHGLDCHRTWESLLMGCFPIVKTSLLDPLFDDLPVIIIDDWNQITEKFLNAKYIELIKGTYKLEKLYVQYWFDKIKEKQLEYQKVALII